MAALRKTRGTELSKLMVLRDSGGAVEKDFVFRGRNIVAVFSYLSSVIFSITRTLMKPCGKRAKGAL